MADLLIKNGDLFTLGEVNNHHQGYGLAIENGMISRIAPLVSFDEASFTEVIDARGKVVMPGFINAHMHFYSSFARGLGKAQPANNFTEVLERLWWRLDKKLSLEDCYMSALTACIEAIKCGTTTIIDHHASPGAVTGSLAQIVAALNTSGLRASICYEVSDRDGAVVSNAGLEENLAGLELAAENERLHALFGLHAAFTLSKESLNLARKYAPDGCGFHIHVAEDQADQMINRERYGRSVVQRLYDHDLLGPQTICAHCVHVDDGEISLLAQTDTIVTYQPQSNMNNAVGAMNLFPFLEAGVLVGLGTDAMTVNMLEELRTGLWLQKHRAGNPSVGFGELLQLLTINNARIAGRFWENAPGVLAEGRPADVILVDYDPITPMDAQNFGGHLIFGMSQARVDSTIANGKVLMRHGRLTSLDETAIHQQARELAAALWDRF